jgi:hypothetical protein
LVETKSNIRMPRRASGQKFARTTNSVGQV